MKTTILLSLLIICQGCSSLREVPCELNSNFLVILESILQNIEVKEALSKCTSFDDTVFFLNSIDSLNSKFGINIGIPYRVGSNVLIFYDLKEMFFYNKISWIEIDNISTRRSEIICDFKVICKSKSAKTDPLIGIARFKCKNTDLLFKNILYEQ